MGQRFDGEEGFKPKLKHRYDVECFGLDGNLKWIDVVFNTNPTVGLNKYLSMCLVSGVVAPVWCVGLVGSTHTYVSGDTMASHAGWAESVMYSQTTRPVFTPGAVASATVDNSASKAQFSISGTDTINGCFVVDRVERGTTLGTLLGEGDFTGGVKSVVSGDTLNVQVTAALA